METLSPLLLSTDGVTLSGNGQFAVFNPNQLTNPNRTPMLIDQFRFAIGQSDFVTSLRDMTSLLVNITFGNSQLTNQGIPALSFCPTYMPSTGSDSYTRMLTWHLPKPLYVPPTVSIGVKISRLNPFVGTWSSTTSTVFGAAIAGRSLPQDAPVPDKIQVPWACATACYSSTWDSTLNETPPFTSKDNEICNPFDADLQMSYLTGYFSNSVLGIPRAGPFLQGTYGSGKLFMRDPTSWVSIFPADKAIIRTRGVMKPKDFLKLMLTINPTAGANARDNQLNFSTIGLTGYRMMETPQ